jgi:hypothetical protein
MELFRLLLEAEQLGSLTDKGRVLNLIHQPVLQLIQLEMFMLQNPVIIVFVK